MCNVLKQSNCNGGFQLHILVLFYWSPLKIFKCTGIYWGGVRDERYRTYTHTHTLNAK